MPAAGFGFSAEGQAFDTILTSFLDDFPECFQRLRGELGASGAVPMTLSCPVFVLTGLCTSRVTPRPKSSSMAFSCLTAMSCIFSRLALQVRYPSEWR